MYQSRSHAAFEFRVRFHEYTRLLHKLTASLPDKFFAPDGRRPFFAQHVTDDDLFKELDPREADILKLTVKDIRDQLLKLLEGVTFTPPANAQREMQRSGKTSLPLTLAVSQDVRND